MMTTRERAQHLANACQPFADLLGSFTADDLLSWLSHELGSAEALETFQACGSIRSKAVASKHILHVVSGNTPHAALQSLLRGLLVGAFNTLKPPSAGLPELSAFLDQLPAELRSQCRVIDQLDDCSLAEASTVIAIGSDSTLAAIHSRLRPDQRWIPHGHKISFALIDSPSEAAAALAARDVSLFNQQGCLSPHAIYLRQGARDFAPMLAAALEDFAQSSPRSPIELSESGAIRNLRETIRYRAAQSPDDLLLIESENDTRWTVIFANDPRLTPSPLNRTIYVRPWPDALDALGPECAHLSTIALHPLDELIDCVEALKAPRLCQLGMAQQPALFWHHDGFAPLASLVTWRDIHC